MREGGEERGERKDIPEKGGRNENFRFRWSRTPGPFKIWKKNFQVRRGGQNGRGSENGWAGTHSQPIQYTKKKLFFLMGGKFHSPYFFREKGVESNHTHVWFNIYYSSLSGSLARWDFRFPAQEAKFHARLPAKWKCRYRSRDGCGSILQCFSKKMMKSANHKIKFFQIFKKKLFWDVLTRITHIRIFRRWIQIWGLKNEEMKNNPF